MALAGTMASILVGLLFFGVQVFNYRSPACQFVIFGATISFLISVARTYDMRPLLYSSLAVIFLLPLLTNSIQKLLLDCVVRDCVFGVCIVASILGARWLKDLKPVRGKVLNEMVLWTLAVVAAYLVASSILAMLFSEGRNVGYFVYQVRLGLLVGMGVSVGTVGYSVLDARRNRSSAL
jgi:hypothetical protein